MIPVGIGIGIVVIVAVIAGNYFVQNQISETQKQTTEARIYDVPQDLSYVIISGKIKPYEIPLNAPQSDTEPEFVLVTDKNYSELQGAIQIALYNVMNLPENLEHVQVSGYYNPENPDWYYAEQGRIKQVIFVDNITKLEPIDLGSKYTTQQLHDRYDQLQKEFEDIKEEFTSGEILQEQYVSALESLAEHEKQLYTDVKEHAFERDEMTEYNFWHRGVMKFPTTIQQEIQYRLDENIVKEECSIQCLVYDPVCGEDGITYACGIEDAACHNVKVKHEGECNTSSETKILYVDSKLVDCVGVGPQQCMLVKENIDSDWHMFYDKIEGFDFQEGTQYKLEVMITDVENPPADSSSLKYTLIEILEP